MRKQMAVLKTTLALKTAYTDLIDRDPGVPGMMLVSGESGTGKTTAIDWLCEKHHGVKVRCYSIDKPVTLLTRIMNECGLEVARHLGNGVMVEQIARYLERKKKPLFVDECDHLFKNLTMLEAVRDIHDIAEVPVILIGHAGVEKKLANRQQLYRRISQWVDFRAADLDDTRVLAKAICDVDLADDLLQHVHAQTNGNPGLVSVGLSRIEKFARANSKRKVDLESWGDRRLFVNPKARFAI
ncbi:MAG TPA: ATP-binding protein [Steroidobacteraceae bacterium]|nr:ATP-binding protein [Steroidobacteraceae bacterium]